MIFNYKKFYAILEEGLNARGDSIRIWMQDALDLSKYQVHRRLTGQVTPSIDEIIKIFVKVPNHALLSFELFEQLNVLLFEHTSFSNENEFLNYFHRIEDIFRTFALQEGTTLYYAAKDIPLFFFCNDRLLLEFKFAVWTNSIFNGEINELPVEVHVKAKKIYQLYIDLPSKELWYQRAIHQQIEQINCFSELGYISKNVGVQLKRRLHSQLSEHASWISIGKKPSGAVLKMSQAPFFTMGNAAGFISETESLVWSALWNAQVISSNTQRMRTDFLNQWYCHRKCATSLTAGSPLDVQSWTNHIDELLDSRITEEGDWISKE